MKKQTTSKAGCAAVVVLVLAAGLCVPNAFSQRRPAGVAPRPPAGSAPGSLRIPPIIGPMGNPVAPIIPSPFSPVPGTTPPARQGIGNRFHGGANVVGVPVAPYYPLGAPYAYSDSYLQPPITIPGLLPGARYEDYMDPRDYNRTTTYIPVPDTSRGPASVGTTYCPPEPELRMIVREPRPDRVVQPPAVGTLRADVIRQLGEPWGTIQVHGGPETLLLDGVTVIIGTDGRVSSTRR